MGIVIKWTQEEVEMLINNIKPPSRSLLACYRKASYMGFSFTPVNQNNRKKEPVLRAVNNTPKMPFIPERLKNFPMSVISDGFELFLTIEPVYRPCDLCGNVDESAVYRNENHGRVYCIECAKKNKYGIKIINKPFPEKIQLEDKSFLYHACKYPEDLKGVNPCDFCGSLFLRSLYLKINKNKILRRIACKKCALKMEVK